MPPGLDATLSLLAEEGQRTPERLPGWPNLGAACGTTLRERPQASRASWPKPEPALLTAEMHGLEHSELVELPLVVRRHWRTSEALVATAQPSLAGSVTSGAAGGCSAGGGSSAAARRRGATSRFEIEVAGCVPLPSS